VTTSGLAADLDGLLDGAALERDLVHRPTAPAVTPVTA
jgi:hypothetical protein